MIKIRHIFHSGFRVELEHSVLLFDWYKGELPDIPADKKLYVFVSHAHPDHYSEKIWALRAQQPSALDNLDDSIADIRKRPSAADILDDRIADIQKQSSVTYILDEGIADIQKHPEADILPVHPREEYFAGAGNARIRILTLESTDMGVAFYVEAEGRRIYHAGDLNIWFWNDEPMEDNLASEKKCREEMQYLADRIRAEKADQADSTVPLLDLAFVPLDPRLDEHAPLCLSAFMEILGAKHVFPMHYWGRNEEAKACLADSIIRGYSEFLCFDDEKPLKRR